MTKARRLGVVFAALALSVLAVSPALATEITGNKLADTATQDCTDFTGVNAVAPGFVDWNFVLIGAPTNTVITVTATFDNGTGTLVSRTSPAGTEADSSGTYHFDIVTPDTWTLVGASSSVDGRILNLSHVCFGNPPVLVPEAPASALLVLSAAIVGVFFLRRQSMKGKASSV